MADLEELERRLDRLESWRESEQAVKREREASSLAHHTSFQMTLSVMGTLTMLVNLFLTLQHFK